MKKVFILMLLISAICFAKIEVIKDDFNGTEYYQTSVSDINMAKMNMDYTAQFRFRTLNGEKNTIIMDVAAIGTSSSIFVIESVAIKFADGNVITLKPEYKISEIGKNFTFIGSGLYAVRCTTILTEKDIQAIKSGATHFRFNFDSSFYNLTFKKSEADKLTKNLNELLNKIK